jgi:hypothetical protein
LPRFLKSKLNAPFEILHPLNCSEQTYFQNCCKTKAMRALRRMAFVFLPIATGSVTHKINAANEARFPRPAARP